MISVIICAAGRGSRTGFAENKLFRPLGTKSVIERTIGAFADFDEILLTASERDLARMKEIASRFPRCRVVLGGETRTQSVKNALKEVKGDIVLIHDGARPFVTKKIVEDCVESVKNYGSGVCALPATDTTVLAAAECVASVPARESVYTVQTPQGFYTASLRRAYELAGEKTFTDDSSLFSAFIAPAHLFVGDPINKKLTFREDFMQEIYVTGIGIDTHAFGAKKDYITLGGVRIPSPSGLIAHSDGDVLVHAAMDALLSAAGLRDIGHYFPDTDPAYRGADSMRLLATVLSLLQERGMRIVHLSAAIQAQVPKLSPYIEEMRKTLARACALSPDDVGITAGTNEGLGYIGEKKGITVTAIATVARMA